MRENQFYLGDELLNKHRGKVLMLILFVGLFLRLYKLQELYIFAHDQDLYSWIVKDIWIDKHFRLIGQITSFPGVFIGSLYYYLLVPFFILSKLDPWGAGLLGGAIGLLNIASIYKVFSRISNYWVGIIGSLIYAVSWGTVMFDRWI